jgi:SMI1 / KNR4 family (SUKH-1)
LASEKQPGFDRLIAMVQGPLPEDYMQLLRNYPQALRNCSRDTVADSTSGLVSQVELLAHLDAILELNHEARLIPILDPDGEEFRWPDSLLIIGETGFGDYYCLDATGEFPGVLQFEHQPVEFYAVADSLAEFTDMLLKTFEPAPDPGSL